MLFLISGFSSFFTYWVMFFSLFTYGRAVEDDLSSYYSIDREYVIVIESYPGVTPQANEIFGILHVQTASIENKVHIRGHLQNVEPSVRSGWHIHSGKTCLNADLVGGHWYDTQTITEDNDPWKQSKYTFQSDGEGNAIINCSFSLDDMKESVSEIAGHSFVVHNTDGERIGCGTVIPFIGETKSIITPENKKNKENRDHILRS